MFSSSSNIQINGGNFYDVARDMNVQNIQTPGHGESVLGVGSAQDEASGYRLMSIESGARMLPYDVSHRPHILSSSFTDARNPIRVDYPHLQPGVDLQLPQIDPLRGHESRDAHSRLVEPHPGLNNSSAIGYYPDWETTSRGSEFNHPSLSATVSLVPNPQPSFPSQPNWSVDPLRRPRPTNIHPVSSTNSGQGPSTSGQLPRLPAAEPPSRSLAQLHNSSFPWDRPLHEPKTSINGGTFISGNVNRYGETGLHILYSAIAGDAFHDSAERYPQPQCHPDTRKKLLDVLHKWACGTDPPRNWTSEDINYYLPSGNKDSSDGDNESKSEPEDGDDEGAALDWESVVGDDEDPKLDGDSESESEDGNDDMDSFVADKPSSGIVWLHGPAGSGKSAVAQSFCQRLKAEGRLGGGFFFKRGHLSRGTASKLLSTIAYQLALIHPELNQAISQTVENDPAIVHRSFFNQLRNLIIEPCRRTPLTHPVVIVIDGLDECEGQNIQQEILRAMATAMRQQPQPILFFIASRPEPHISEVFNEPILDGFHCALDIKQSFEDVRKYLLGEFGRIHREHRTMATVSRPWPSSEVMDNLVNKSSGYFIYASTIIKYIDDKNFRPKNRLEIILGIKERGLASPFDTLDQLYVHILSEVPLESRSQLLQILTILGSRVHPTFMSVSEVEQLLELHPGDLRLVLRNLHSVIKVPEASDSFRDITVHHASFLDFLNDPTRSGPFYLRGSQHCMDLLRCILNALGYEYSPTSIGCTAWYLAPTIFEYITSIQLSPDFVPLLLNINPDFLFWAEKYETQTFFDWLNLGVDLPLWNDYQFMFLCDQVWSACSTELTTEWDSRNGHEVWLQVSPQLIRILRAFMLFPDKSTRILFQLHFFLEISWDEMRAFICPLRALVSDDKQQLRELFAFASDPTFVVESNFRSIIRDLALGGLHMLTGVISDKILLHTLHLPRVCGLFLRFCAPAPDFLKALEAFEIAWRSRKTFLWFINSTNDIHNLSQWLKTFPQLEPPLEVLTRLDQRFKIARIMTWPRDPEEEWIQWLEKRSQYFGPLTKYDSNPELLPQLFTTY